MRTPLLRLLPAAAAVVLLAGCGGSGSERNASPAAAEELALGQRVFGDAGCGDCHTLAAAGSTGATGPNLDQLRPERARVARQVENGGPGMPAFGDRLSDEQIDAVARFVSESSEQALSVAAEFEPDETEVGDCAEDYACLEQAYANLAYRDGPKSALAAFDRAMVETASVELNCHRIAHAIGAGALARLKGDVGEAFAQGSPSCWSGYYHGILERAFRDVPEAKVGAEARRLCSSPKIRRTTFLAYQCVHGLGHGLMIYTGYDLPGALRICDRLANDWDQTSCTGGVFMENLQSSYGFTSKWLKKDDLLYPCPVVEARHKLYCYLMVTSHILPNVDWDWGKASAWCRRSEPEWVDTCFQSLGRDASGQTRQNAVEVAAICARAGRHEEHCVYGAARDMVSNDFGPRRAVVLCNRVNARFRRSCFHGVGTILGTFGASEGLVACRRFAQRGLRACIDGVEGRPIRP